jgi:hypothetical protein
MTRFRIATIAILAVVIACFAWNLTAPAQATSTDCVPQAAYDETVVDKAAWDETVTDKAAWDETVIDTAAIDRWYSWTGGPSDSHPAPPAGSWQVDNGSHDGFDQSPGLLQRDKGNSGNSDWFYHLVVAEVSHVVHHAAETHVVHHAAETHVVHHDAVTCPPPATTTITTPPGDDEETTTPPVTTTPTGHKYYVCKYVGTPGEDERPQPSDQNPIFVDEHSIASFPNIVIGAFFADAQGRSKVIAGPYDKKLDVEPGIEACGGTTTTTTTPPTTTTPNGFPVPALFNAAPTPATCVSAGVFNDGALGGVLIDTSPSGLTKVYSFADDAFRLVVSRETAGEVGLWLVPFEEGLTFSGLSDAWTDNGDGTFSRTIILPAQLSGEDCPTTTTTPPTTTTTVPPTTTTTVPPTTVTTTVPPTEKPKPAPKPVTPKPSRSVLSHTL